MSRQYNVKRKSKEPLVTGCADGAPAERRHKKAKITTTPTFTENFNPGDLIFGLKTHHNLYETKLPFVNDRLLYVARLNKIDGMFLFLAPGFDTPEFRSHLKAEQQAHLAFLLEHASYINKPGGKDPNQEKDVNAHQSNIKIRRACKLTAVHGLSQERTIHFILDGIDHKRVTTKKTPDGKQDLRFTSAELRALFRCRDKLGDSVIFYKRGKVVKPPWISKKTAGLYKAYDKIRRLKVRESTIGLFGKAQQKEVKAPLFSLMHTKPFLL
ncbi:MAG: hypothetical protein COB66_08350 [Coxiella sp. (in: Bacteria)]|nr:MAG: hypothetical protein COB66_08350 [Coxiella sp. (in: g-proteobacteria)]